MPIGSNGHSRKRKWQTWEALEQVKKLADGDVRIYGYRKKNGFMSILEDSLLFESSDGLVKKTRTALIEEESPRAEYRLR